MKSRGVVIMFVIWPLLIGAARLVYGTGEVTVASVWPILAGASRSASETDRVNVYSDGDKRQILETDPCHNSTIENAVKLLAIANDTHRLFVTPSLIEKLKKEEKGVEIIFVEPKNIKIHRTGQTLKISKIFIPITGKFAESYTTIFYADPIYDDPNQCINSVNKESRKKLEACLR